MNHATRQMTRIAFLAGMALFAATLTFAAVTSRSFSAADRVVIDENALWSPRETFRIAEIEAYHSFFEWLQAQVPVPPDVFRSMVAKRRDAECRGAVASDPGGVLGDIWTRLVKCVPESMASNDVPLSLTVLTAEAIPPSAIGGGFVIVGESYCSRLIADDTLGLPSLAFALARAIGHDCLGHSRRRYRGEWALSQLSELRAAGGGLATAGSPPSAGVEGDTDSPQPSYSRDEDAAADLFAIHLCRYAGVDTEGALDLLRSEVVADHPDFLRLLPRASGRPPVEPEFVKEVSLGEFASREGLSPVNRLRRLRIELDGLCNGDEYGLFVLDPDSENLVRAGDDSLTGLQDVIVFVHGMESSFAAYLPLARHLRTTLKASKHTLLFFQYPNDGSLAHAGVFLSRELLRSGVPRKNTDFICHSAGGLVARYYAEALGGAFRRLCLQGTPHGGSDLAGLRTILEAKQFLGDLDLGHDRAMQKTILDGRGQISIDLTPGSVFLQYLNHPSHDRDPARYFIQRARRYSRTEAYLRKGAFVAVKKTALSTLRATYPEGVNAFTDAAADYFAGIELPEEILSGDLCVTLESAVLPGVKNIKTYDGISHTGLPSDEKAIRDLVEHLSR